VEATRLGAYDFIEKPLSMHKLLVTVDRALVTASLARENLGLLRRAQRVAEVVGSGAAITALKSQIRRIATHKTSVFITGESGSGKETFARYLHGQSPRATSPFIDVNVAGLARENPAAELFGSEEGDRVRYGSLERAHGGTLFLKDIADLDLGIQARLLGALENQALLRVGGREPVRIDVRIVAATRRNLQEEVAAGRFRDDLYYHLNVVPLHVPALREHAEDTTELLEYYVRWFRDHEGLPPRRFSAAAQSRLRAYPWPGNVRELRNLVQRLLILGLDETIEVAEIESALGVRTQQPPATPGFELPLREAREQFERAYLEYQLQAAGGSVSKVADKVGMERTHLYRKLRMLGIDPKQIKEASR
jgi:DNA-binding NtrC family response regulator